jgi:hypothetical protein
MRQQERRMQGGQRHRRPDLDAFARRRDRREQRVWLVARPREHRLPGPHRVEAERFGACLERDDVAQRGSVEAATLARGKEHTEACHR